MLISTMLTFVIITDLQILDHPKSSECYHHAQVTLSVSAVGPGPLLYKWSKDGVDIDDQDCTGVNEPTLIIRSFSLRHEGKYTCEVKHVSNHMFVKSNPAKLELSKYC